MKLHTHIICIRMASYKDLRVGSVEHSMEQDVAGMYKDAINSNCSLCRLCPTKMPLMDATRPLPLPRRRDSARLQTFLVRLCRQWPGIMLAGF